MHFAHGVVERGQEHPRSQRKINSSSACDHRARFGLRAMLAAEVGSPPFVGTVIFETVSGSPLLMGTVILTFWEGFYALGGSCRTYAYCTATQPLSEGQEILLIPISRKARGDKGKLTSLMIEATIKVQRTLSVVNGTGSQWVIRII